MCTSNKTEIYIIGAGGLGRELAAVLMLPESASKFTLRGFIDDNYAIGDVLNGILVSGGLAWLTQHKGFSLYIAIGNGLLRKNISQQLQDFVFPCIIHPAVNEPDDFFVHIGNGSYIAEGCVLTTNIQIGRHTLILPSCSLSHDTTIGDFCTLIPGVRITSGATIGNNVHIGAGTIIAKNTTIPPNTSIPPGTII